VSTQIEVDFDKVITAPKGNAVMLNETEKATIGGVCLSILSLNDPDAQGSVLFKRAILAEKIAGGGTLGLRASDVGTILEVVKTHVKQPAIYMQIMKSLGEIPEDLMN
tara:strand:- start:13 stop:336 length:324 start_codon:yes stop_codon:yes gene_type:complete